MRESCVVDCFLPFCTGSAEEIADTYEAEAKDLLNGSKYFHFMDSMSFFTKKLKR